jgi:ABC-type Fe3+/spermidine/putrescine transport system ATPase subunit
VSAVVLDRVAKQFGATSVVRDISLALDEGEVVALLGPSGSGKTTTLRLIAGFESVDRGRIHIAGRDVTAQRAVDRRCGMVFQHYALFPHMSVAENVAYGLADRRLDAATTRRRVADALALVALAGYQDRAVTALSGGQQQRVALARALAPEPAVLLLDEPLSNLDPSLREHTRRELGELVRRIGITTVLVTHEQEEAFELADRVALLLDGGLAQIGPPEALYREPASEAVASFIGRATTLAGVVIATGASGVRVRAAGVEFEATGRDLAVGTAVRVLLRPEALRPDSEGGAVATVVRRRFAGADDVVVVRLDQDEVEVAVPALTARVGDVIRLGVTGLGAHAFGTDP